MSDVWRVDRGGCRLCGGKGWFKNPLSTRADEAWECSCRRSREGLFALVAVTAGGVRVELTRKRYRLGWARLIAGRLARRLAGTRGPAYLAGTDRRFVAVEVVYLPVEAGSRPGLVRMPVRGETLVAYPVADAPYRPAAEAVAA